LSGLIGPSSPTVTADGRKLAFIEQSTQIYVAHRDGSGLTKLTNSEHPFASISFGPSGDVLVAATRTKDVTGFELHQMVFVKMDGTVTEQLKDASGVPIYADTVVWLSK